MTRQDYIYELVGKVQKKDLKTKKDGQSFYQLAVEIFGKEQIKKINVFKDGLEKKEIWGEIEKSKFHKKEYLFFCKNFMGSYFLVNWKEYGQKN